jgi:Stc1 domain
MHRTAAFLLARDPNYTLTCSACDVSKSPAQFSNSQLQIGGSGIRCTECIKLSQCPPVECATCGRLKPRHRFGKKQGRKGRPRVCKDCVLAAPGGCSNTHLRGEGLPDRVAEAICGGAEVPGGGDANDESDSGSKDSAGEDPVAVLVQADEFHSARVRFGGHCVVRDVAVDYRGGDWTLAAGHRCIQRLLFDEIVLRVSDHSYGTGGQVFPSEPELWELTRHDGRSQVHCSRAELGTVRDWFAAMGSAVGVDYGELGDKDVWSGAVERRYRDGDVEAFVLCAEVLFREDWFDDHEG